MSNRKLELFVFRCRESWRGQEAKEFRAYFKRLTASSKGKHRVRSDEHRVESKFIQEMLEPSGKFGLSGLAMVRRVLNPSKAIPFYPRAVLLAGNTLFIAGPSEILDFTSKSPTGEVWLWTVSTEDGNKKAEYKLKAAPVHDSFAASQGNLYFTTVDGRVVCYQPEK